MLKVNVSGLLVKHARGEGIWCFQQVIEAKLQQGLRISPLLRLASVTF